MAQWDINSQWDASLLYRNLMLKSDNSTHSQDAWRQNFYEIKFWLFDGQLNYWQRKNEQAET